MVMLPPTILATPCRLWQGAPSSQGYGVLTRDGLRWYAHRWVWTQANGPIPEGMCVLHRCDNRRCVQLDHLFLGTMADNAADMVAKGRHAHQLVTHCPQGHPYDEANTRFYQGRRYCKACKTPEGIRAPKKRRRPYRIANRKANP